MGHLANLIGRIGEELDEEVIQWIGLAILPHEIDVRRWLGRDSRAASDADDLIQESYARIANSARPKQIDNPRAYFFRVVKNLLIERIRREKLVRIEAMAEIDSLFVIHDAVPADRHMQDREELAYVMSLLERLPARSRDILLLRRIEGLSQRETAQHMGVSENVVEKQTAAALGKLLQMLRDTADSHGFDVRGRRADGQKRSSR